MTLHLRMAEAARYQAGVRGYRITGLRGYHELGPAVAVGFFGLTRGCLVIVLNGEESRTDWYGTYTLGEPAFTDAWEKTYQSFGVPANA